MNDQNVIDLHKFKFSNLDQYLRSVDKGLREAMQLKDHERPQRVRLAIGEFFMKLRIFRGMSLREASAQTDIEFSKLDKYENGHSSIGKENELKLVSLYQAERQYYQLCQRSLDIQNNIKPKDKRDLAVAMWTKLGVLPDGFSQKDFKNEVYGRLLPFSNDINV